MESLYKKFKWLQAVFGALVLLAGALIITFSIVDFGKISTIMSITVACVLFVYAAILFLSSILLEGDKLLPRSLVFGAAFIALGTAIIKFKDQIETILILFASVLLIAFGAIMILKAILLLTGKTHKEAAIVSIVIAAICVAIGILSIIYENDIRKIIYIGIGALIAIYGLYQCYLGLKRLLKKEKKEKEVVVVVKDKKEEEKQYKEENTKTLEKEESVKEEEKVVAEIEQTPQIEAQPEVKELDFTEAKEE